MFRKKETKPSAAAAMSPGRPATAPAAAASAAVDDFSIPVGDDIEGRVKVTVRVRPPNDREGKERATIAVNTIPEEKKLTVGTRTADMKKFQFDNIMTDNSTQKMVYMTVARNIVQDCMKGYNGTILAYGQSGSGKTHTIVGNHGLDPTGQDDLYEFDGIIPSAIKDIFASANQDPDHTYEVHMCYVQIYMEMIQDLLRPESKDIRIREDPEHGVFMTGVMYVPIYSWDDCHRYMNIGNRNRNFAFTRLNAHSSRSHAVLMLMIERRTKMSKESIESGTVGKVQKGKLFLIDLAGSERLKKSGSEGLRAEEAKAINLSLSVLGNCIHALADERASHVPYRDSKLTRLLEDSLGGNAKTSLVITVGPAEMDTSETLSSLMFGKRAMKVKVRAMVNEEIDLKARVGDLQADLDSKDEAIMELQIALQTALAENERMKAGKSSSMGDDSLNAILGAGAPGENTPLVNKLKKYIEESTTNYKEVVEGLVKENKSMKDQLGVERMNHTETQKALEAQFKKVDGVQKSRNAEILEISKSRDAAMYQLEKVSSELKSHIQRVQREKLELEDVNAKLSAQLSATMQKVQSASTVNDEEFRALQNRLQQAHAGVQKFRSVYFVHLMSGAVQSAELTNAVSALSYWRLLTRARKIRKKAQSGAKVSVAVTKAMDDAAFAKNEIATLKSELRMKSHQWQVAEQEYISGVEKLSVENTSLKGQLGSSSSKVAAELEALRADLHEATTTPHDAFGELHWSKRNKLIGFNTLKTAAHRSRRARAVVAIMGKKRFFISTSSWWRSWVVGVQHQRCMRRALARIKEHKVRRALAAWQSRARGTDVASGPSANWKKRAETLRKELMARTQMWEEMEFNLKDALRRSSAVPAR